MDLQKRRAGKGNDDNLRRYQQLKQRKRLMRRLIMWALAIVLLILLVVLLLKLVFVVKKIEVRGAVTYTEQEILELCGVSRKDDILLVSEKDVNARLCEAFPYIKEVSVQKDLPSTLILEVKEEYTTFYTELEGQFFLFNHSMRLMDRFDSKESLFNKRTAIHVKIPLPKSCIVPQYIRFYGDDSYILSMISLSSASVLVDDFIEIDLRDRFCITLKCRNDVDITFGDYKHMDEKIQICEKLLSDYGSRATGHIDLSVFPTVYYDLSETAGGEN